MSCFLPFFCSRRLYSSISARAIPWPRYSGRTLRPSSMTFSPFGSYRLISSKKASRNFVSFVASPFSVPAIFPVFLSTAARNSSGAYCTRSRMLFSEHASFGGKHASSMATPCSISSWRMVRSSYRSILWYSSIARSKNCRKPSSTAS